MNIYSRKNKCIRFVFSNSSHKTVLALIVTFTKVLLHQQGGFGAKIWLDFSLLINILVGSRVKQV